MWRKFEAFGEVNAGRAGHVTCLLNDMLYMYAGGDGTRMTISSMHSYIRLVARSLSMRFEGQEMDHD